MIVKFHNIDMFFFINSFAQNSLVHIWAFRSLKGSTRNRVVVLLDHILHLFACDSMVDLNIGQIPQSDSHMVSQQAINTFQNSMQKPAKFETWVDASDGFLISDMASISGCDNTKNMT